MKHDNLKNYTSPSEWRVVQLKDLCERITKGSTPTSYGYRYTTSGIRFVKAENIDANGFASTTTNCIDESTHAFLKRSRLKESDLLFSIAGTIGRVGLVRPTDLPANTNQALAIIRLLPGLVDPKYLFYFLKSDSIQSEALKRIVGVGRSNLSLTDIGEFVIPVAPPDQQKLIVAEIEKQFSRLDEAVANLKRVKANLKRYKAAVLKAAVEGKLTEEWRKAHPEVEPASELLKRILAERRARWDGAGSYKEPVQPRAAQVRALQERWAWATFEQLSVRVTVGHVGPMKHEYVSTGVPFLRSQNVRENKFDPEGLLFISPEFHAKLAKSVIHPGDLAVVRSGSVGVTCVIPDTLREANCADLVLIQGPRGFVPEFGAYYMNSLAKRYVEAGKVGIALTHFNTKSVAAMPFALPPFAEQKQIVAEVERRLSVIDDLEAVASANGHRTERLRQSLLQKAFSGRLTTNSGEIDQQKLN